MHPFTRFDGLVVHARVRDLAYGIKGFAGALSNAIGPMAVGWLSDKLQAAPADGGFGFPPHDALAYARGSSAAILIAVVIGAILKSAPAFDEKPEILEGHAPLL